MARVHAITNDMDAGQLGVDLTLAVKRLRARLRAESATNDGWTISQLSTLAHIVRSGPMTASAIAQIEHVRPQSIAEICTTLKAAGLIVAAPDPTDGRKSLLRATAKGRRLVESVTSTRAAWLAHAIDAIVEPNRRGDVVDAITLLNQLAECDV